MTTFQNEVADEHASATGGIRVENPPTFWILPPRSSVT